MLCEDDSEKSSFQQLLSKPGVSPRSFTRVSSDYENHSAKFVLKDKNFQRQYAHIYASRLWSQRKKLENAATEQFGNDILVRKLFELKSDEKCVVIGTLFKNMELKPSILKEISEEHGLVPLPPKKKFVDDSDVLILEDELQRIVLTGNIDIQAAITGTVVAVLGQEPEDDRGKFHVERLCYQPLPEQVLHPPLEEDRFLALVSGLELGSAHSADALSLQLFVDVLTGQLGDEFQQSATSNITRLVVAGNSLGENTQDKDNLSKAKYLSKKSAAGSVEGIKALDDTLTQLAACMEVDVMAGGYDPASYTLPQQPLHCCMLPQSSLYPTMHTVTNPYHCSVDGVSILGTSGQPVLDIYKYSSLEDHLEILERTLEAGHLAPTAPDTLGCYPYSDTDPFILDHCPHIYFAGNMPEFKHKFHEGAGGQRVLLVTVPRFSQTHTCVLVNLRTLQCQQLKFNASFPEIQHSSNVDK